MFICFCDYTLTLVESFIGHAVDVAGAALRDKPLHHRVHTGLPVRTPDGPTDGQTKPFNTTELTRNRRQRETCVCVTGLQGSPCLTLDFCEVTNTHSATHTRVEVPANLQVGMVCVWPENKKEPPGHKSKAGETGEGRGGFRVKEQAKYLQCSSSELENASNSRPMLIITMLVSGHT